MEINPEFSNLTKQEKKYILSHIDEFLITPYCQYLIKRDKSINGFDETYEKKIKIKGEKNLFVTLNINFSFECYNKNWPRGIWPWSPETYVIGFIGKKKMEKRVSSYIEFFGEKRVEINETTAKYSAYLKAISLPNANGYFMLCKGLEDILSNEKIGTKGTYDAEKFEDDTEEYEDEAEEYEDEADMDEYLLIPISRIRNFIEEVCINYPDFQNDLFEHYKANGDLGVRKLQFFFENKGILNNLEKITKTNIELNSINVYNQSMLVTKANDNFSIPILNDNGNMRNNSNSCFINCIKKIFCCK